MNRERLEQWALEIGNTDVTAKHPVFSHENSGLCSLIQQVEQICSSETRQCEFCNQNHRAECCKGVRKIISRLLDLMYIHFSEEEALMRQYGAPNRENHLKDHADISTHLTTLIGKMKAGAEPIIHPDSLFEIIECWVLGHLLQFDEPLEKFIKKSEGL